MYWFNKTVWFLSNPMTIGLFVLLLALYVRKVRLWCLLFVVCWFYVLSTGWCFRLTGCPLEWDYPQLNPGDYPVCDAIVDLGGGVLRFENNKTTYPELASAADRVYWSALLWRAGKAPIIITSCHGVTNADDIVLSDLGVPASAIVSEERATTTEENAKYISKLFANRTNHRPPRILLVTSAWHMKRSLYMFRKYAPEVECVPVACDYEVMTRSPLNLRSFIPDPCAFELNCRFLHEWLGILGYHFRR